MYFVCYKQFSIQGFNAQWIQFNWKEYNFVYRINSQEVSNQYDFSDDRWVELLKIILKALVIISFAIKNENCFKQKVKFEIKNFWNSFVIH